ncbi:MarC family protein [Terasakiella pusilla]|jgi:multiple antibiotic resistance protein|uniref:MarC family protein n=1 Tax=Terasakiella pusilla TaxID=64973 RepID=UPI00048C25C2|nr:MarC family protein [Terasakiella pusilla]
MVDIVLQTFVTLFVIIDPIGLTPMFIGVTAGATIAYRRRMAIRAFFFGSGILLFFALIGHEFLGLLGIEMSSFRIAGGVMLFLTGLEMVFGKRTSRRNEKAEEIKKEHEAHKDHELEDISVFPLAIPFLAGPGSITSIMLLMEGQDGSFEGQTIILLVALAVMLISLVLFLNAHHLEKILGEAVSSIFSRILGVLLAALASQYIMDGIRTALFT